MNIIRNFVSSRRADVIAILGLVPSVITFFWRMIFTGQILPRGDSFAYFYPYWSYRNLVLAQGHIPLWNPYLFMGAPFLANSQAGVLYPLNWLLIGLDAPQSVNVAIVMHALIAAFGMYIFCCRVIRLTPLGGFLAAVVFVFAGYFPAQAEHINQYQGLAWLPWLFWLWNEAVNNAQLRAIGGLSAVVALQFLAGHTQTTFISMVGLAFWAALTIFWRWRAGQHHVTALSFPVLWLVVSAAIAVGLASAQLLPTAELSGLSNRSGGLPFIEAISFSLQPGLLGRSFLPYFTYPSLFTEYIAYPGVAALLLVCFGTVRALKHRQAFNLVLLGGLGLFLALGAYNPVYWALVKIVPGFQLFRVPARWLALWALSAAGLAGYGLDTLVVSKPFTWKSIWPTGVIIVLVALSFLAPVFNADLPGATAPTLREIAIWLGTCLVALALIILLKPDDPRLGAYRRPLLASLIALEVFAASFALPLNHLNIPLLWTNQRPSATVLLSGNSDQVAPPRFLSLSDITYDPGDLRELQAVYSPYLNQEQLYDFVVAAKQKEVLTPNLPLYWGIPAADGYDGGLLPTREYNRLASLIAGEIQITPDGRLRENLKDVPDLNWLALANIGWIITDKNYDAWLDNVYYDLQFPQSRTAGDVIVGPPVQAYPSTGLDATQIGIVGHYEADSVQPIQQIGTVAIFPAGADLQHAIVQPLLVHPEVDGGITTVDNDVPVLAGNFDKSNLALSEYRTLVSWGEPILVDHIEITVVASFSGKLVIRGVSVIDARTGAFVSTTLSDNHSVRVANSGDVKIYQFSGTLPRAYLSCDAAIALDDEDMWEKLAETKGHQAVIVDSGSDGTISCEAPEDGTATITRYTPESIEIKTSSSTSDYLILSDSWYPGWSATIDGTPTTILKANGIFRAIRLPAGEHQVGFEYKSSAFETGKWVSIGSLIALIIFMALPWSKFGIRLPASVE